MSTTSTEKRNLPDLYKLVYDRVNSIKNDYGTTFSKIFPDITKPDTMIDPLGNKRLPSLSDYVELYQKAFEEHPPYAINDGDYHIRTEATATPGTINRIQYNEEEDRYYGLFNHSTIMKSDDLETWEDAMKLSVDEEYAFMNAEIEFFLFNLANTYYAEGKTHNWVNSDVDRPESIGALKGTRIKEFRYVNGVYLIVVENCLSIPYMKSWIPTHPTSTSDPIMKRAFTDHTTTGRKDAYYEIVYATEILSDPRRWKVVTSGPKAEWEGIISPGTRYSAGNNADSLGDLANRPHVREFADMDTDWRNTWTILMTNGDYFVSHDKFHSFTEQHVDNLAIQRRSDLNEYDNNRYPRMFNAISHYQYYDVDGFTVSADDLRTIILGGSGKDTPQLAKNSTLPLTLDSNSSPHNNIWVVAGMQTEILLSHDLSTWIELKDMMDTIQKQVIPNPYGMTITHLLKMGRGCTLSRFEFSLVAMPVINADKTASNGWSLNTRNDDILPITIWFHLGREIPAKRFPYHSLEIDGLSLSGAEKVPVVQRSIIALESWTYYKSAWNDHIAQGQYTHTNEMNVCGLYGIHNPNADEYRPYWDIKNHQYYSMDYVIGCGITPDLPKDKSPIGQDPRGADYWRCLTKYSLNMTYNVLGRTQNDNMPLSYKVKLPGEATFTEIKRARTTDSIFDIASPDPSRYSYENWDSNQFYDAVVCFSRSRNGCVVAYGDTIYEYAQAPETGVLQVLNTVKLIPNMMHANRLAALYHYDMGDPRIASSRAPANDAKVKAPDLVGNSYLSSPYTVKYSPETGMYFAWERYNVDASLSTSRAEIEPAKEGDILPAQVTTIRFLYSYDGEHWEKTESPPFNPNSIPANLGPDQPSKIEVAPFSTYSNLGNIPAAEFEFDARDWTIKDIYTFRGYEGTIHHIIMLVGGWYVHLNNIDYHYAARQLSHLYMNLFPLESVLWNRLFLKKSAGATQTACKNLPYPYGYNSFLVTRNADFTHMLVARPHLAGPHNGTSEPSYSYPLTPPVTIKAYMTDYIKLENDTIIAQPIIAPSNSMFTNNNTNVPLNTTIAFPLYQTYLCRSRLGSAAINNKYILHRYNEIWRNMDYGGTGEVLKTIVQGALNRPDNVGYDNIDTASVKAAKGSYIGSQFFQNSTSRLREDMALYENASPGYITHALDGTTEAEGSNVIYMTNPLGHYNYNLFMLVSNMTNLQISPWPSMSYRAKGFGSAMISMTSSNYEKRTQYVRDFGSHIWSFFDRGTDKDHASPLRTAFESAVQVSMGHHDREGVVSNKGHYYVNFMEVNPVASGGTFRGIRTIPAAIDLSMMPYDFKSMQFDDNMTIWAKFYFHGIRPNRILTYDGMTIYNYSDRLLYRNYGKMETAHDVLLQAYNDKQEAIYGRANQSLSNPFVEGSLLQKENNKLFLTSPTGQLSLVEMERPADIDDIGTTKCLVDPDTMVVQYGTRRELETKEEWRPIYNADIKNPYATNQIPNNRPNPTTDTPNKSLVEATLGVTTSGRSKWAGPKVRTWKDFIFIVDRGRLRVLSKQWQDGWVDDYPVEVYLDTNGNGTGNPIYILDVLLLDMCDTVDPFVTKKDSPESPISGVPNPQSGMAMLYLVCNTMIYGMAINPHIMRKVNLTESENPRKPAGSLDNILQKTFQGIISGTIVEHPEIAKIANSDIVSTSETISPYQIIQTSTSAFMSWQRFASGSGAGVHIYRNRLSLDKSNIIRTDWRLERISTNRNDFAILFHSGPLVMHNNFHSATESIPANDGIGITLDIGNGRTMLFDFDIASFFTDVTNAGFIKGTLAATPRNVPTLIQDICFNPDSGEIVFMVKTVGSAATTENLDKSNLGLMKYRITFAYNPYKPQNDAFYTSSQYVSYNTTTLTFLGSARCDHIDLVDMEYYNHQWIAVGYKAPYTLDRYGSTVDAMSKHNTASLSNPNYDATHAKPTAQNILHACYSKDGLNWGEFYNLEVARPVDYETISNVDKPYLIVDNERGNCLIYDGAGRVLAKTISKKYALENQVILGEQTNIYAKAVYRGYDYARHQTESPASTYAGCDIVIGAIYPEYMFGESFDIVHLSGIELLDTPMIDTSNNQAEFRSDVMGFQSMAIAAFDSFNLGVSDRQDSRAYQYPYDIDYNANGRSGGLYTQFYYSVRAEIGDTASIGGMRYIPLEVIQERSILFSRANNPNSKNYDYPIWEIEDGRGTKDCFPSNRYFSTTNDSDALCQLGVWAYPRQVDKFAYFLYTTKTSTMVDTNVEGPDSTSPTHGKFVDYDYPYAAYTRAFQWKNRSNARFEYSPIALTQNLSTKHGFMTLYQSKNSTVLYFPSVGKVWIHLNFLGAGTSSLNYDAQYIDDTVGLNDNSAQLSGIHRVESGSYNYSYVTIIGRKMETLHTYDQQVNIAPVISSPCLQMFDQS